MLSKHQEKDFSFFKKETPKKNSLSTNIFHLIVRPYLELSTFLGATILTGCLIFGGFSIYDGISSHKANSSQEISASEQYKILFNNNLYSYRNLDLKNFIIAVQQDEVFFKTITDNTVQLQLKNELKSQYPFHAPDYTIEFNNNKIYKIYIDYPTKAEEHAWRQTQNVFMILRGGENIDSKTISELKETTSLNKIEPKQLIVQFIK